MTNEFKDMLYLLKCSLRGEEAALTPDMNYSRIGTLAMQQQIMPLIFNYIEKAYDRGIFKADTQIIKNMKKRIVASVAAGIQRQEFLTPVLARMEEKGIKCILLKGALLADLYPCPELRISGDIDLYVDEKDEPRAIKVLEEFGFIVEKRLNKEHHSECRHKIVKSLELHVSLYEDYCTDLWFDSITFDTGKTVKYTTKFGHTYNALEPNEQLIYNILHLIKHFLSSGIGIRQITDIILFVEKNYGRLDAERYAAVMKSLKFDYFMDCCMKIGTDYLGAAPEKLMWINDCEIKTEDCEKILEDIEESGLFGHNDARRRTFGKAYTETLYKSKFDDGGKEYKKKRQKGSLLSMIFLDYDRMKPKYKYLKHGKWLLPIAWIHRGFRTVFGKKTEVSSETADLQEKHLELMRNMKIL